MKFKFITILLLNLVISLSAKSATIDEAALKTQAYLSGFPDLGPGYAMVIVSPDKVVLRHVQGVRNVQTKTPLTYDTPIYIASQTKAILGLLANILDQKGVLKLTSTLDEFWPELTLPGEVKAKDWTLSDLLNHMLPLSVDELVFLEAYVTALDYQVYPALLETYAVQRQPGYVYDNLGYNLYSAILEQVTGKSWQQWLDEEIFKPLSMSGTSARTSDFTLDALSWNHVWMGQTQGYVAIPPKSDAIMQSAGGVVMSVNDMAKWLKLQLTYQQRGKTMASAVPLSHQLKVNMARSSRNPFGLPCDGYGDGWNHCEYKGHNILIHGGGYTGSRTVMAFSTELQVGIAVFSNSDNQTGWHTGNTMVQFLDYLTEQPDADEQARRRQSTYPEFVQKGLDRRYQRVAENQQEANWDHWQWQPNSAELKSYSGLYQHPLIKHPLKVMQSTTGLELKLDSFSGSLKPAKKGVFAITSYPLEVPQPVVFDVDDKGVRGVTIHNLHFVKQD